MLERPTIAELKRLGYRLPRRTLLPPYMHDKYFQDFGNIIDSTFSSLVDDKIETLRSIRKRWVTTPEAEALILDEQMMDSESWPSLERDLLVRQVNSLGMYLAAATSFTDESMQNIARFLGKYWWERGTYGFIEFMNYVLTANLNMRLLWSQTGPDGVNSTEYVNMTLEEEDGSPPGTPMWEGGDWFRTTHVSIISYGSNIPIPLDALGEFFYEIANYNLVLDGIEFIFFPIVVAELPDINTEIVAHAVFIEGAATAEFTLS